MKNLLFITVSCLCLLAVSAKAQMDVAEQLFAQALVKVTIHEHWGGRGADLAGVEALHDPVVLAAFGISDEQYLLLLEHCEAADESSGINELEQEMNEEISTIPDNWMDNARGIELVQSISEKMEKVVSGRLNGMVEALDSVLTPEQWQKMWESQLANMAEMPILSTSMFEVFDLTDAQKRQLENIKQELEPEFEKTLKNYLTGRQVLEKKLRDERKRESEMTSLSDREIIKKLMAEDPEYKKIIEEIQTQSQAFATKFKIQMFDVLTDEQWLRLQNLIDNPPEHALVFRKALKELSSEDDESKEAEKSDVWVPGPNSWRPGDPIPIQYRLERSERGRFPRGE